MAEMQNFYKDKKVFITGHTGFKGSWLCEMLLGMGAKVYGYALQPPTTPAFFDILGLAGRMDSTIGDIRDYGALLAVIQRVQPEIVIHMAAQPIVRESYAFPRETYETNIMGTVNLMEAVRIVGGIKSFLNVTTDKVYRNDGHKKGYDEEARLDGYDPYSNSKSCSELVTGCYNRCFFSNTDTAVSAIRAGNVIGGGDFAKDRLIPDAFRALSSGQELLIRNPAHIRPFWHALDACYAYLLLAMRQHENKDYAGCYNVGPDENDVWKVSDVIKQFSKNISNLAIQQLDARFENGEGPHEDAALLLNSEKFRSAFAWKPAWDAKKAVLKAAEWYVSLLQGGDVWQKTREQIDEFTYDVVV